MCANFGLDVRPILNPRGPFTSNGPQPHGAVVRVEGEVLWKIRRAPPIQSPSASKDSNGVSVEAIMANSRLVPEKPRAGPFGRSLLTDEERSEYLGNLVC